MSIGLRGKLLAILGGGIISLGLISGMSFVSLSHDVTAFEDILEHDVAATLAAGKMTLQFKTQIQEWKNVLLRGHDDSNREKYWAKFQKQHNLVQESGRTLLMSTQQQSIQALTQKFLNSHKALLPKYKTGYQAFISSGYDSKVADAAISDIDQAPTKLAGEIATLALSRANSHKKNTTDSANTTIISGISIIILSMLSISFFALILINRRIINPVQQAQQYLEQLSKGQLNFSVKHLAGNDELARMYLAIEQLQSNLNRGTDAINGSINILGEKANNLHTIATTIEKGTEQQYVRTDQMATAITEMSAASSEVARHAKEAAQVANEVEQAAQTGVSTMNKAISTLNATSEQISSTADVVRSLEEDTENVGTVLDVIRSIADQTNLLALNAAIEAARAGEHGRGFAVVADEVRTLAQRTQESTAEIQTIIENLQSGAKNAVTAIETGQNRTQESVIQVTQAGETIEDISASIKQILGTNEQIAQAAQEQSHVAGDISQNVNGITSIAEDSSGHAKDTLLLSEELKEMSDTLGLQIKKIKA